MENYFNNDEGLDGYYVSIGSDHVYIPCDRVQYFSVASDGQLINLSSSTITCYALDNNGNRGSQYRFQSFSKAEKYVYYQNGNYNSWWQWDFVNAYAKDSNITFGQTGLNNINSVLLFIAVALLGCILFFRK